MVDFRRESIMFSGNTATMWIGLFYFSFIIGTISTLYPEQAIPVSDNNSPPGLVHSIPSYITYKRELETELDENATNYHDFVFGVKGPKDHLLLRTTVYRKPRIWSRYISKEITFPPPRSPVKVTISQVKAHDKGVNATGGFVKIIGGGIGKGNITILFTSHANLPIHFGLEIYGTRR